MENRNYSNHEKLMIIYKNIFFELYYTSIPI